ncbi:MAG: hypothetical protein F6K26_56885, partial [Moorea sp. SIO2I5]|nr:hypothetical protein [Moorena sp. SIO2I5]
AAPKHERASPPDWEETPASVKKLVEGMAQQIENLEKQLSGYIGSSATAIRKNPTHIKELIIASFL